MQRTRFLPRLNYHFDTGDKLNSFVSVAAGYLNVSRTFDYNDPDYGPEESSSFAPVAMRLAYGMRYFFNENLAGNLEFGIGGGNMAHFGISYKL